MGDLADDLDVGGRLSEGFDGNLAVESGQGGAEAQVDTRSEAEGIGRVAVDPVHVGVGPVVALVAVAELSRAISEDPAGNSTPLNRLASLAVLTTAWLEFSNRSISSRDEGMREGSRRTAVKMSGWSLKAKPSQLARRPVVVSVPAVKRNMAKATISSGDNGRSTDAPSVTRRLMTSVPGCALLLSVTSSKKAQSPLLAVARSSSSRVLAPTP